MEKFRYDYKTINTKLIVTDERYQRQVDFMRVKKIVGLYNPNLVNPIKVSLRSDGKYYCFDGQHTVQVQIMRNGNKNTDVECKVYYGMTFEDEASLFAQQNGEQAKNVTSTEKLNALAAANDVDVISMKEIIEEVGFVCDFKTGQSDGKRLVCYSTAYSIYKKWGGDHLKEVMNLLYDTWHCNSESITREMLIAVDIFTRKYEGKYSKDTFVRKLQKISPIIIKRDAKAAITGGNGRYARELLRYYNKSNRFPLEDKF